MTLVGCWGVPPLSSLRSQLDRDIHDIETESGLKDAKYQQKKITTNYNISQQKNERETGVDDSTWLLRVHHYAQVAENESSPKVTKYQLNLTKYHTL